MFRGQSLHNLDSKGRLRIPARFREVLKQEYQDDTQVMITTLDKCLAAYPTPIWKAIEEKIVNLSTVNPEVRRFKRYFISGAQNCSFDKQGRILIPQYMRRLACFNKEILLAGMLDNFEIWSKSRWDEEMDITRHSIPNISQKMAELGI